MITNAEGKVAIRHWNSNPSDYTQPKYNVSLGWVDPKLIPKILAEKTNVCCGQTRAKYRLANELDIRIWETGSQSGG